MKNLLNRLTRFMIIMLLLVDRTPFFNVYADAATDESIDNRIGDNVFELHFDTDGSRNLGVGDGNYEKHYKTSNEDTWYSDYNLQLGDDANALATAYKISPKLASGQTFLGFKVVVVSYASNDGDLNFIGISTSWSYTPVANNDTLSGIEDEPKSFDVFDLLANDTDRDGDPLSVYDYTEPNHGSISLSGTTFTYTPELNYFGPVEFQYRAVDLPGAISNSATVTINIEAVNDLPVALDETHSINRGATINDAVSGTDVSNETPVSELEYVLVTGPTQATATGFTLYPNGTFEYIHDITKNSTPDSFTFRVKDGDKKLSELVGTVTINISNLPPTAVVHEYDAVEDTKLNVTVADGLLVGSADPEGDDRTVDTTVGTGPTKGIVVLSADGSFEYTPDENKNGSDSFTYRVSDGKGAFSAYTTVTINIEAVNDLPVASDDKFTVAEGGTFNSSSLLDSGRAGLFGTDADTDASLTYSGSTLPAHGTVSINPNGTFTYTHDGSENFSDSFDFTVSDGTSTDTGTITITITAVNDNPPVASDDKFTVAEGGTFNSLTLSASDVDLNTTLTFSGPIATSHGSLEVYPDGTFTYTHDGSENFSDSFDFTVSDGTLTDTGTITITITPVNDNSPVAVDDPEDEEIDVIETPEDTPLILDFDDLLANDYDVDDLTFGQMTLMISLRSFDFNTAFSPSIGTLRLDMTGRTVTFTPPLNYVGPAQFEYTIIDEDENVSEPATVFIEVTPVNDAPVASPLAFTIANAGSSTGQLVASDVDDTELVFSLLAAPTNGSATVSPTGAYTYTHNGTATLSDSFTFSVTDGELSATAVVTVTITAAPTPPPVPTNLPPVANALAFTIANDATSTGTLTGSDPEGAPISFAIATLPANGSLTISPAGIYVYNHNGTATTADSFTFTVSDGSLTSTATVTITILPIPAPGNTPPEVIDGVVPTEFGEPVEGSVAPLGSDADGDDLTFALVDGPTNGTLVFNPDGTYTYTPNDGFNGSDSFTFIANDGTDDSETGTLTINVLEEEVIVEEPETPLAAPDNNWLWWLLALLAGLLLWLLAFLRPNMKYTLSDKANNQKVVRRRLAKPDDKTMIVELNDKDMVGLTTIEVEFFKRLAKHCGDVTVKFMLKGTQVHSVTIPADIDDVFTTIIHL